MVDNAGLIRSASEDKLLYLKLGNGDHCEFSAVVVAAALAIVGIAHIKFTLMFDRVRVGQGSTGVGFARPLRRHSMANHKHFSEGILSWFTHGNGQW